MPAKIHGLDEAQRAYEANLSPRSQSLLELERYVDGTQYAGLKSWYADAPIDERAPSVVYPIVKTAIDSNVDLLLGDTRKPQATARPDENDEALGVEGLTEDESANYDRFLCAAIRESRFWTVGRAAFAQAQAARSSATVWGLRNGRLVGTVLRARWCEPELDADGNVTRLVETYPFIAQTRVADGWRAEAKIFRRVIDAQSDTTYLPLPADASGRWFGDADWTADPARTVKHGLGFCPVVWYAHMRGPTAEGSYDGIAIHEHLLDEIRAHDYALSQRDRAALYAGDPQWTECGVEEGHNPSPGWGADGSTPATPAGGKPTRGDASANPVVAQYRSPGATGPTRKKGPGQVWTYESPDTKVDLHTLPGDALKSIADNADALKRLLCDSLAIVIMDPETVKFAAALSGKAIEALRRRQFDRVDQFREDFGDHWIKPSLGMVARIAATAHAAAPGSVLTPGVGLVAPMLAKFRGDAGEVVS